MKNIPFLFAVSFILISASFSCTPVRVVSTQEKENIDYNIYRTFNFMDVSFRNDAVANNDMEEFVLLKTAIAKEMEHLGYVQADNPDLWINIGIVVEQKTQTRTTDIREAPLYIGQRRYHWESEEVVVANYEEGTVSVDMVDADKNERVWEGVAAGTVTDNPQKLEKRINKVMELLFQEFPK